MFERGRVKERELRPLSKLTPYLLDMKASANLK
jgi:hypothetical protein